MNIFLTPLLATVFKADFNPSCVQPCEGISDSHIPAQEAKGDKCSSNFSQRSGLAEDSIAEHSSALTFVPAVCKKEDGGRMYNKKQHCLYCSLQVTKISRHIERKHCNEVDVARAPRFSKGSKQRRIQLDYLRNKGNFAHNAEVLHSGKGYLIPCKLTKEDSCNEMK